MLSNKDKELLLDAMVLLEVADQMYPQVSHYFTSHTTSNLISAAHDLVQHVQSNGESKIEKETQDLRTTLDAARKYIDSGGHLWKSTDRAEEAVTKNQQKQTLWTRIRARMIT